MPEPLTFSTTAEVVRVRCDVKALSTVSSWLDQLAPHDIVHITFSTSPVTERSLRARLAAKPLYDAANRFCDEVPDYRGRIDHSMISQFGEMQRVFEDAVNAYDEAMNPEGDGDG